MASRLALQFSFRLGLHRCPGRLRAVGGHGQGEQPLGSADSNRPFIREPQVDGLADDLANRLVRPLSLALQQAIALIIQQDLEPSFKP
ncbi:MAG: hypothetical protein VB080_11185 [Propionicimonas sp.]|nr:hypothetical protein [Propionicimonas sp.]MEA4944983.1 hypothetical protein [Propionicimonas sp.]